MATKTKKENLFTLVMELLNFISAEKRTDWFFGTSTDEESDIPSIYVPFKYANDPSVRETAWEIQFNWDGNWTLEGEYDCSAQWFLTIEKLMTKIDAEIKKEYWCVKNFDNEVIPSRNGIANAKLRAVKLVELGMNAHPQFKSFCEDWNTVKNSY